MHCRSYVTTGSLTQLMDNINSQLDATIIILLIISISSTCFGRYFRPSLGALPAGDQDAVEPHPGHQQAASPVLYTTSCKHSLVLLRMGENIARNILRWLKLLIKLLLLQLVGCVCYHINYARSHKHQTADGGWIGCRNSSLIFKTVKPLFHFLISSIPSSFFPFNRNDFYSRSSLRIILAFLA